MCVLDIFFSFFFLNVVHKYMVFANWDSICVRMTQIRIHVVTNWIHLAKVCPYERDLNIEKLNFVYTKSEAQITNFTMNTNIYTVPNCYITQTPNHKKIMLSISFGHRFSYDHHSWWPYTYNIRTQFQFFPHFEHILCFI